ncbi:uncharacterized protein ARMOST_17787 [Armillaria ostoyae]|uniref:Uncharacterized protein n=1 Tax=Armillaria ostoyae TaxID=47428 RepID=A0A284RZZ7_ARMOS|nr:uncharacterized protein ARMOST_17787 [Armillaria ostoyae]
MHDWPPTNCTKPSVFFIPTLPSDNPKAKDAAERIEGVAFFSTDHGCEYHPHANHQRSVKGASDVLTARVASPSSSVLQTSSGFSDERIQGEPVESLFVGNVVGALSAIPSCPSLHLPSPLPSQFTFTYTAWNPNAQYPHYPRTRTSFWVAVAGTNGFTL